MSVQWRWRATLWLLVAGFLSAFALAPGLWLSGSALVPLPILPLRGDLSGLPRPLDLVMFLAIAISLPLISLLPRPRRWLMAWIALFLLRVLWDKALWQPYFIEYLGILALLVFLAEAERERALGLARLILIASYLWPGISKIDHRFVTAVAPGTLEPLTRSLGLAAPGWLGAMIPVTEIAVAVLLFSRRLRLVGVALALVTHAVILLSIGPTGHDIQRIVWPWNLVLPALVVMLFAVGPRPAWRDVLRVRDRWLALVAVMFFALPALSYVVPIEPYVALRVYSTKIHEGVLLLSEDVVDALPERSRLVVRSLATPSEGRLKIRMETWSERELGGYLSPSRATHLAVARRLCGLARDEDDVTLLLLEPPDWRTGAVRMQRLGCDQLRAGPRR